MLDAVARSLEVWNAEIDVAACDPAGWASIGSDPPRYPQTRVGNRH
jgi:hypothetical protein